MAQLYCGKCTKTMLDSNFYTYKDGNKCELCKSCLTMHIDTYDPSTFLWMLEKFDVPYIEAEWKTRREKEFEKAYNKACNNKNVKDPRQAAYNMTKGAGTIFGKYLSQMKLKQWKQYTWADTERLKAEAESKMHQAGRSAEELQDKVENMKKAYENGEISEAQLLTYMDINPDEEDSKSLEDQFLSGDLGIENFGFTENNNAFPTNENPFEKVEVPDVGADLTEEDKVFLAMKWGRLYTAADWVWLEQKYNDFMNSFDIQGAARVDTLTFICKTSLKMNQALDAGDIDTYQKLSKVYDAQMKAAKFTEAQRKEEKAGDFDAVGQVVFFAEKVKGKIERHEVDEQYPLDIVDKAIFNLKHYNHELVINDPSLSQMFENFIKRRENAEAMKADEKEAESQGLDRVEISDSDINSYREFLEEEQEGDID